MRGGKHLYGVHVRLPVGTDAVQRRVCQPRYRLEQLWQLWPGVRGGARLFEQCVCVSHGADELFRRLREPPDRSSTLWYVHDGVHARAGVPDGGLHGGMYGHAYVL